VVGGSPSMRPSGTAGLGTAPTAFVRPAGVRQALGNNFDRNR